MKDTDVNVKIARMDERIKHLESLLKPAGSVVASKDLEMSMPYMRLEKQLSQIEGRLKEMEGKPTKRWDTLIAAIISATISFISLMLNRFII